MWLFLLMSLFLLLRSVFVVVFADVTVLVTGLLLWLFLLMLLFLLLRSVFVVVFADVTVLVTEVCCGGCFC